MLMSDDYYFEFEKEIGKYADGVHELNGGCPVEAIDELEKKLELKLPDEYRLFLQIHNGGELFIPGTELLTIQTAEKGEQCISYLDEALEMLWPGMPEHFLIVAVLCYGDFVCLDLNNQSDGKCRAIKWDHELGEISGEWSSFKEWLADELSLGSEMRDYDGVHKDL